MLLYQDNTIQIIAMAPYFNSVPWKARNILNANKYVTLIIELVEYYGETRILI